MTDNDGMRRVLIGMVVVTTALVGCANEPEERAETPAPVGATSTSRPTAGRPTTSRPTTTTRPATTTTPEPDCPTPTTPIAAGLHTIDVDGTEREYRIALPAPGDAPAPVILDFHGSGSSMDQQVVYSDLDEPGTARGYVVITPNGTGTPRGWSLSGAGDDDAFVDAMLATVAAGACVDLGRVFAVGISNGSAYSALMACRAPYRIAAVGMVAATIPSVCPIDHPMPAVAFHGTADEVVPYGGGRVNSEGSDGTKAPGAEGAIGQWAERNGCGAPTDTPLADDVTERTWADCPAGADVRFYSVRGGGHTWPGGIDLRAVGLERLGAVTTSISATTVFLDFFDEIRAG